MRIRIFFKLSLAFTLTFNFFMPLGQAIQHTKKYKNLIKEMELKTRDWNLATTSKEHLVEWTSKIKEMAAEYCGKECEIDVEIDKSSDRLTMTPTFYLDGKKLLSFNTLAIMIHYSVVSENQLPIDNFEYDGEGRTNFNGIKEIVYSIPEIRHPFKQDGEIIQPSAEVTRSIPGKKLAKVSILK